MKITLPVSRGQAEFILCKDRFITLIGGRRFGKGVAIKARMIANSRRINHHTLYITPSFKQSFKMFEKLYYDEALKPLIAEIKVKPPLIRFRTGATIEFESWNNKQPDDIRGDGVDELIFDEIQSINPAHFDEVALPMISDRRGTLVLSGQHRGESWYYKKYFRHGIDGKFKKKGYKSFVFPSTEGLVFQSPEGRQELLIHQSNMNHLDFGQEYMCELHANTKAVFRHDDLEIIKRGIVEPKAKDRHAYVGSLDIGDEVDPCASVYLEIPPGLGDNIIPTVCFAKSYKIREKHSILVEQVARTNRDYTIGTNMPTLICDTTGIKKGQYRFEHDPYTKYYSKEIRSVKPYTFDFNTKPELVNNLMLAIENGRINIPESLIELHEQLSGYEFNIKPSGRKEYGCPPPMHDDLVSALMMAWHGFLKGWWTYINDNSGIDRLRQML